LAEIASGVSMNSEGPRSRLDRSGRELSAGSRRV